MARSASSAVKSGRLGVLAEPFAVGVGGVLFLEVAASRRRISASSFCRLGAIDGAAVALADEAREAAGVVDVGVGEEDGGEGVGVEGSLHPVELAQGLEALEHAAIDEEAGTALLEQKARARDGTGAAVEGEPHAVGFRTLIAHRLREHQISGNAHFLGEGANRPPQAMPKRHL